MSGKHIISILIILILLFGCAQKESETNSPENNTAPAQQHPNISRISVIPINTIKMLPDNDSYPPIMHSLEWENPVPFSGLINTAGAEDSPFITQDGNDFYFFFTPDTSIPAEKQLFDNVTGIWHSHKTNGIWSEPERIWLIEPGKLALDGCEFVQGNEMWFCSAREGYAGINLFTSTNSEGKWGNIRYVGDKLMKNYETGEMHISSDGSAMYFHSGRAGGKGQSDIWVSEKENGEWNKPVNLDPVNSADNEGWPYLSANGKELWFTRFYLGSPAIFRSSRNASDGIWGEPELIISQFAGEPTLDNLGNIYFTHHFYKEGKMIEADIYVAKKK